MRTPEPIALNKTENGALAAGSLSDGSKMTAANPLEATNGGNKFEKIVAYSEKRLYDKVYEFSWE